jgi:hypothetical protein
VDAIHLLCIQNIRLILANSIVVDNKERAVTPPRSGNDGGGGNGDAQRRYGGFRLQGNPIAMEFIIVYQIQWQISLSRAISADVIRTKLLRLKCTNFNKAKLGGALVASPLLNGPYYIFRE